MRRNLTSEEFYSQYKEFLEGNAKTSENGTEIGSKEYFDSLHREISNELTELDIRIASTKERLRVAEAEEKLEAEKLTLETENFKAAKERADRAWRRYYDAVNALAAAKPLPANFEARRLEISDLLDYAEFCRSRQNSSILLQTKQEYGNARVRLASSKAELCALKARLQGLYIKGLQADYVRQFWPSADESAGEPESGLADDGQLDTSCIV